MKLTNIAASLGLALGSQLACAAGGPLDLSSGSTGFFSTPIAGGFVDLFTFTLTSPGTLNGSITSVVSGTQDVDFVAIYITGVSGVFSFTQLLPDPFETWALSPVAVAAGDYTLALVGFNSPSVGSYGGNLGISVVPEPQPYALLIAGMVGIGFFARRRHE